MTADKLRHVERVLRDGDALDRALVAARGRVIRHHRQLGIPLVIWQDGRVVEISPFSVEPPDPYKEVPPANDAEEDAP